MYSSKLFALVLVIGAAVIVEKADADMKCKGEDIAVSEEVMMNVKECFAVVGIQTKEQLNAENGGCFSRCVMMKRELIDGSGKPHKENINKMIDDHMPKAVIPEWKAAVEKCLDSEGSKIDVNDDKTCQSFLPLSMCVHMAFMKICKGM